MFHRRTTDQDIERLLSGKSPEDDTLTRMLPLVEVLKRAGERVPSEAETHRVAAQAARLAGSALKDMSAGARTAADSRPHHTLRATPRLAGALVVILLLCSTTGVAFAANGAAPGDALYGLDRAVERIGIGSGGLQERLTEASMLADRGRIEEGLAHAAEALEEQGGPDVHVHEARAALLAAANAVGATAAGEADQIREQVAEMLRWMATTEATGDDLTQGIATRARAIAGGSGAQPAQPSTVDQTEPSPSTHQQGDTQSTTKPTTQSTAPTSHDGTTATSQQGSTTGTTAGQPMTTTSTAASQSASSSQVQGTSNGPSVTGPSTSAQGAGQP